jgi:predicted nucleotidyltransferase
MIDLQTGDLQVVRDILQRHASGKTVWAFGSRVTGKAKKHSDLDLAVIGDRSLTLDELGILKEAFAESDLPFRVDIADWNQMGEKMRKKIQNAHELIQEEASLDRKF